MFLYKYDWKPWFQHRSKVHWILFQGRLKNISLEFDSLLYLCRTIICKYTSVNICRLFYIKVHVLRFEFHSEVNWLAVTISALCQRATCSWWWWWWEQHHHRAWKATNNSGFSWAVQSCRADVMGSWLTAAESDAYQGISVPRGRSDEVKVEVLTPQEMCGAPLQKRKKKKRGGESICGPRLVWRGA